MCLRTTRKNSCVPISADPQSAFLCYSVIVRITDFFQKKKKNQKKVIEKGITLSLNIGKAVSSLQCVGGKCCSSSLASLPFFLFHKSFQSLADISHFVVYRGWYVGHYRWCRPCSKVTSNSRAFQEEKKYWQLVLILKSDWTALFPLVTLKYIIRNQPDTLTKNTYEFSFWFFGL